MKKISFAVSVILVAFMTFGLVSSALAAAQSPTMQIHIYLHPDIENAALESGTIDLNDWPLTKDWIDKWALMPEAINLRDYVELGMMEVDINNQMWPTGDSGSKFYSASRPESVKSVEFRKAVACLLDRDAIVRDVLKGYGFRMDLPMPPFQSAFVDMYNYTTSGLIYNYNVTRAAAILDAAGFTVNPLSDVRIDPVRGGDLQPIIFYIRQDDPNRRKAGEMLTAELLAAKIPVNAIITEKTVCYKNAMVLYNYHLYTGGWSLSTVPDQYHDLYSSYTYYGPSIGWSQNYPGFCNAEFDSWAVKVKYPDTIAQCQEDAKVAGYLFLKYCAMVPMYCSKAVKAYRTGWTGVVNNNGFGIDNYWTFLNMKKTGDTQIDWGFKSDIEQLNQVSSEWLWDQNVLGLIYESLIGTNPFNLNPTEFFLATAGTIGTWDASGVGGTNPATVINWTLRSDVYWHNVTGSPRKHFTANDVAFSFDYQKACGPGIAWNYPSLSSYDHAVVYDDTHVAIFYKQKSAWAYQWSGGLPMINGEHWSLVGPGAATKTYDPANQDLDADGVMDLFEDGTGAWMYVDYVLGNYVDLDADPNYYLSQAFVTNRLAAMFHNGAGDVNNDGVVSILDLSLMARSLGTTTGSPHGTGWGQYNTDCDLDLSGVVDLKDLTAVTSNYGKTMG
jgi:ABC-type transport system substrate-binding protein